MDYILMEREGQNEKCDRILDMGTREIIKIFQDL